ncbi:hypothetical protein N5P37_000635 [Trichoderma harzianum]|uniref:Uncharacterized protein n=1 Tax=Trichoderma harzianum CBS 226.95 TaxID=983964 RepID=A0A2T4AIC5_TRIHA|nr:hypothetical protein M431DRAFT_81917 [Trichoderma harzianum CBS 226.95]KAK0766905.1 hypothetical protein N5P37_000635 [Trichoderma harzianum]PKK54353.1 hypothetical protein CI102_700 [Trichoderma harzianum]PTB56821.1 hypothetical protein M431DRAFT_81917 [Trichoderma harzianum CBS 226.95]
MPLISTSTWNSLGLSVAATFAILGSSALFDKKRTAELFSLEPSSTSDGKPKDSGASSSLVGLLVGTRDLTMATTLFALHRAGHTDAMGTVILSSMIICAADVYIVWKGKKRAETAMFAVGAGIWAAIGFGLKGYFD